jgi:hypothetical protein
VANINQEHISFVQVVQNPTMRFGTGYYLQSTSLETFDENGPDRSVIVCVRDPLQHWTIRFTNENLEQRERDRLQFVPILRESTTFERATNERATKESRNMSAATKERSDKRAPRQKSAATKERRDKLA